MLRYALCAARVITFHISIAVFSFNTRPGARSEMCTQHLLAVHRGLKLLVVQL